jgi:glutaredoxin
MMTDATKKAELYRMVMPDHICPYGLKSKDLLERKGFEVEDHHLTTRAETDAFMERYGVETTPQICISGERIGGYDELRIRLGIDPLAEVSLSKEMGLPLCFGRRRIEDAQQAAQTKDSHEVTAG